MKTALVDRNGHLQLADVDVPRIGHREILVKMTVCGVCGTDLEKLQGVRVTPPILGHEVCGEVVDVGDDATGYSPGDRVAVHHHVPCGNCYYCTRGDHTMCPDFPKSNLDPCGFAEYFRVPEANVSKGAVIHIPPGMGYEEAALAEPTGCCIRGLNKLRAQPGESFLVIGTGPAGVTHIVLLRAIGAQLILAADLVKSRLEWAKRYGADVTLNAADPSSDKTIIDATEGRGVDKVIVASGSSEAIEYSLRVIRKGGTILLFGIPKDRGVMKFGASDVFIREINLVTSYSTTESEIRNALEMMAAGRIRLAEMITHRFRLEEIAEAFRTAGNPESSLKVMVHA